MVKLISKQQEGIIVICISDNDQGSKSYIHDSVSNNPCQFVTHSTTVNSISLFRLKRGITNFNDETLPAAIQSMKSIHLIVINIVFNRENDDQFLYSTFNHNIWFVFILTSYFNILLVLVHNFCSSNMLVSIFKCLRNTT